MEESELPELPRKPQIHLLGDSYTQHVPLFYPEDGDIRLMWSISTYIPNFTG
jgi:hypothetical protein